MSPQQVASSAAVSHAMNDNEESRNPWQLEFQDMGETGRKQNGSKGEYEYC